MVSIILGLMGGLGLFLFGMDLMGGALEEAAGAKMRSILEFFTKTPIRGILIGTLFTAIIQSSSATTVMVVSFVNSGLMNLFQATGVIMGANIGTTATSLLISLNLSDFAPVIVMVGVIMALFVKDTRVRRAGKIILGFGFLFMGMSMMSGSMSVLKESPKVAEIMSSMENPLLALLLGIVVTAVLQSSSASIGIIQLLALQGLLDIPICLFMILGCNIGASVPPLLAGLNGKRDAKRASLIYLIFNVLGAVFMFVVISLALTPITGFLETISGHQMSRAVAAANVLIKVVSVLVLAPFTKQIVALTDLLVRKEPQVEEKQEFELRYIGKGAVFSPATAVLAVKREMERMGNLAIGNLQRAMEALLSLDEMEIEEVYRVEKQIDFLSHEITSYLVEINQTALPQEDKKSIAAFFHVVNDLERIGDHAENVADDAKTRIERNVEFSAQARWELSDMREAVIKTVTYALDMFVNDNFTHMQEILDLEDTVDAMERELQQSHIDRLTRGECTAAAGMMFSDLISGLERVADHAINIAFSLTEEPEHSNSSATQAV